MGIEEIRRLLVKGIDKTFNKVIAEIFSNLEKEG
jgi:hypothetical protein